MPIQPRTTTSTLTLLFTEMPHQQYRRHTRRFDLTQRTRNPARQRNHCTNTSGNEIGRQLRPGEHSADGAEDGEDADETFFS